MGGVGRQEIVETVRAAADLREIVSDYIPLKKSGARYRALCPFHTEKTPSFYVDADKQLFYCFGCGAGGDVFKFLMLYEKLEFPEALKKLAGRFGIALPASASAGQSERQKVIEISRRALGFFCEQLRRTPGEKARAYLAARHVGSEAIERFQLGCSPEGWSGLKDHLASRGAGQRDGRENEAVLAGLLGRKEETGRTYDRFRDRVMFPIVNLADEVVGFGGRTIGAGEPKYLNSPDTPAFSKGENLYALPLAKEAIRKVGHAILVEGYLDAIALHQAGVTQAVATLGTGFTTGHVRLLKRYTDSVVMNFDPDAAGRTATRRSLEVLLENGFEVRVVALPPGKDPDLYVREEGGDAYRRRLQEALPYIEYLTREVAARVDLSSSKGKVEAMNGVLPFLARLDNPIRRAGYVEMLSTVFGIEDRVVLQELKDAVRERRKEISPRGASAAVRSRFESEAESRLVRALLDGAEVRVALLEEIEEADLEASRVQEVVRVVRRLVEIGEEVTYARVGAEISDDARDVFIRIAAKSHPAATLEEGRGCLVALRAARLEREMGDIQKRLESGSTAGEVDELLRRKTTLKRKIEALPRASA